MEAREAGEARGLSWRGWTEDGAPSPGDCKQAPSLVLSGVKVNKPSLLEN